MNEISTVGLGLGKRFFRVRCADERYGNPLDPADFSRIDDPGHTI